jgi:hypothetical protein
MDDVIEFNDFVSNYKSIIVVLQCYINPEL